MSLPLVVFAFLPAFVWLLPDCPLICCLPLYWDGPAHGLGELGRGAALPNYLVIDVVIETLQAGRFGKCRGNLDRSHRGLRASCERKT